MARNSDVPVSSLVLDYDLYPRQKIDTANVSNLVRALNAGETIPPIIVERSTKRVVDGFHRIRAIQHHAGPDATIAVSWRDYDSDADLFLDAVELNAAHGVRISRYDQARCLQIAARLHVDQQAIAGALHITVDATAKLHATKTAIDPDGKPMPIRRTARHLAGRRLSRRQYDAEKHTGGMSIRFYAEQVRNAIAGDLIDWDDEATVLMLQVLDDVLHSALTERSSS